MLGIIEKVFLGTEPYKFANIISQVYTLPLFSVKLIPYPPIPVLTLNDLEYNSN